MGSVLLSLDAGEWIELGVALGTAALAVATVLLGVWARGDAGAALNAARRPAVIPIYRAEMSTVDTVHIGLENVGPGAALNVRVEVFPALSVVPPTGPIACDSAMADRIVSLSPEGGRDGVVADVIPVPFHADSGWMAWPRLLVVAHYEDTAGNPYVTRADLGKGGAGAIVAALGDDEAPIPIDLDAALAYAANPYTGHA